jgi:hypothetical protein
MASTINAISGGAGGLTSKGDASGALNIQTAGTTAIAIDASQNVTFAQNVSFPNGTLCKAWVNFDGTTGTIRNNFNVTSVTKSSTSNYTISFTTAMSDTSYVIVVGAGNATGSTTLQSVITACNPINASSCFVSTSNGANAATAYYNVAVAVFR